MQFQKTLREMALDKQKLSVNLHKSQQINSKIVKQWCNERNDFQKQMDRLHVEINDIRKTFVDTKVR